MSASKSCVLQNDMGDFYDDAKPTQWTPWQDYSVGDIVKYKEFFYTADTKIAGSEVFEENKWIEVLIYEDHKMFKRSVSK